MSQAPPALAVESVTVRFGGVTATDSVSFEVASGQIYAVIGPNGAGKTTLFNAVTGVHPPDEGSVRFWGHAARLDFTWRVAVQALMIGLGTAIGFVVALNAQEFWQAAVIDVYEYGTEFNWGKGLGALADAVTQLPAWNGLIPALIGVVVGAGTSLLLWHRARGASDVVARFGVARTFQNIRLFGEMSLIENVLVGMDHRLRVGFWAALLRLPQHRADERWARHESMELLRFVGLDQLAERAASSLSYGHRRRLEIARALASGPRILLLDEPAAGMNPSELGGLMDLIRRIRDHGLTVVLIEHHMKLVMGISDSIAVLQYGKRIAAGTPEVVRADPRCVEAYLGTDEL